MKSKSFNSGHTSGNSNNLKRNRTFDFVNLYKSAADTSASWTETRNPNSSYGKESHKTISSSFEKAQSSIKKKKKEKREPLEISQLIIEGPPNINTSAGSNTPVDEFMVTSTPRDICKKQKSANVKSIMKVSSTFEGSVIEDSIESSTPNVLKPKKRNKSVSFMLEGNEEITIKKSKSNDLTITSSNSSISKVSKHFKKHKKYAAEKENNLNTNHDKDKHVLKKIVNKSKINSENISGPSPVETRGQSSHIENSNESKKTQKKIKKLKELNKNIGTKQASSQNGNLSVNSVKNSEKLKKKKHQERPVDTEDAEPVSKSHKRDKKPDVIVDLENLSIGDNAHTVTNLLDEMTVTDAGKRNKMKRELNKNKKQSISNSKVTDDVENIQHDAKKWQNRKWNKDTKAIKEDNVDKTVIVENLPLSLLFTYKKLLPDRFVKYGLIKSVGIAQVFSTDVSSPVFSTTINFYSDVAASQALQEDQSTVEGSCIAVKCCLPPTDTTLVVRSYGPLTAQYISSVFNGAGRIRDIRQLVKGKRAMSTFFIEFDGPTSTKRALEMAADVKVGGKKVYLSKFETRTKKIKQKKTNNNQASDAEQHCDDSQE